MSWCCPLQFDQSRNTTSSEESVSTAPGPPVEAVEIGERTLWVGNANAARPEHLAELDRDIEHVLTVNRRRNSSTTAFHPLFDGRVNEPETFEAAVETARGLYKKPGHTLIHCAAGISRSPTVIATVLAVEEQLSFEASVEIVRRFREPANPHPKLRLNALWYLATTQQRREAQRQVLEAVDEIWFNAADVDLRKATDRVSSPETDDGWSDLASGVE